MRQIITTMNAKLPPPAKGRAHTNPRRWLLLLLCFFSFASAFGQKNTYSFPTENNSVTVNADEGYVEFKIQVIHYDAMINYSKTVTLQTNDENYQLTRLGSDDKGVIFGVTLDKEAINYAEDGKSYPLYYKIDSLLIGRVYAKGVDDHYRMLKFNSDELSVSVDGIYVDPSVFIYLRMYPDTLEDVNESLFLTIRNENDLNDVLFNVGSNFLSQFTPPTGTITTDVSSIFGSAVGDMTLTVKTQQESIPAYVKLMQWGNDSAQALRKDKIYSVTRKVVNYDLAQKETFNYLWVQGLNDEQLSLGVKPLTNAYASYNVIIPAYKQAQNFEASYSASNGIATLSWNIEKNADENITGDDFEIEGSIDPNFDKSANIRTQKIKFDPEQIDYTMTDDLSQVVTTNQTMYYRVRRTAAKDQWGWELSQTVNVPVSKVEHAAISSATIVLDAAGDGITIKWDTTAEYWSKNTVMSIEKMNKETNATSTIELNEAQYNAKTYTDTDVSSCIKYAYKLQVIPGQSFFTKQPAVKAMNGTLDYVVISNVGTISDLRASKGFYPDRVNLQWHAEGMFDEFVIKRIPYPVGDAVQIGTVQAGASDQYFFDDDKGTAGSYYTYEVYGAINCAGEKKISKDTLSSIGFRNPQGNIYGNVAYDGGQAEEGVEVRVEMDGDDIVSGSSIYLQGNPQEWLLTRLSKPFKKGAFTFQAWIKPTDLKPEDQILFSQEGLYEVGFDSISNLYLKYGDQTVSSSYKLDISKFTHFSFVQKGDTLSLYVGDTLLVSQKIATPDLSKADSLVFTLGSNSTIEKHYKGYIDEVRLWDRALDSTEIARDYKRLLAGNEQGLVAYYRFDETIADNFYDISHVKEVYNENHGVIIAGQNLHSDVIPTTEQLSLKGVTDSSGNYFINGVPYVGRGSTYKVIPRKGTHAFDPTAQIRFVGGTSLSLEANFTDKSSFPVSGIVYYSGSRVPVQGVNLKIDGVYANDGKGNLISSKSDGSFKINVPVGIHEVRIEKQNHVFEGGGRIMDIDGNDLNYQTAISERELNDSTTVRVIGRVAGGAVQEAFMLGNSLSTNNLGENLKITLTLASGNENIVTADRSVIDTLHQRANASGIKTSTVDYKADKITIIANKETGEFVADLIPEPFIVTSVTATGHKDLLDNSQTLDLSNKLVTQYVVDNYTDSTASPNKYYTDSIPYNDSCKFILRVNPQMSIKELVKGKEVDYFGNDSVSVVNLLNKTLTSPLLRKNPKDESEKYLFGNPTFTQNTTYTFQIKAFESYEYFEEKDTNNPTIVDSVPTTDGKVMIDNYLRHGPKGTDEVALDDKGEARYQFTVGEPIVGETADASTKNISASLEFSGGNSVKWTDLKAYVMGSVPTGTDIVTQGPNRLITVLRDPPGSNSYAYLEKGTTISNSIKTGETFVNNGSVDNEIKLGADIVTVTGTPFFSILTKVESENSVTIGLNHEEKKSWGGITNTSTTISDRFSTSDDPLYVGADGDLLIGNSTNISYGIANTLVIIPSSIKKNDDTVLSTVDVAGDTLLLVKRSSLSTSIGFGTMFTYPTIHIANVLIPNLQMLRNSLLLPSSDLNDAQDKANIQGRTLYVSHLDPSDENYGASNTDKNAFGDKVNYEIKQDGASYAIFYPGGKLPDKQDPDSIHYYNQSIENWFTLLAQNEEAKIEATDQLQNYTFQGGSVVEHSREYSFESGRYSNFEYVVSGSVAGQIGFKVNGLGMLASIREEFGGGTTSEQENTTTSTRKEGFVLSENGADYISVDVLYEKNSSYTDYDKDSTHVFEGSKGPFVYRTKGGATSCPYEGALISKYYVPGTVISEPTMRIEVPHLSVDKNLITNVPSNRKAVYTLSIQNQSETKSDAYFVLNVIDKTNPDGAVLSVDGIALGNKGRTFLVPYGEILSKTLEIARGPKEMNYNDIQLVLHSECQYDPTNNQENIADSITVSAQFIPSCSDVNIKLPLDKWIVNTTSPMDKSGLYILPITLDGFDVNNSSLERFEIQYKQEDESIWTVARVFYKDPALARGNLSADSLDLTSSEIKYDLVMTGADSRYDIRAASVCRLLNEELYTYSATTVTGTKDTKRPVLFGSPQPANGILEVGGNVLLNFNEIIKEGALSRTDFQVTGIRNGAKTDHSVSVTFDGAKDYIATEADKNLADKDLSIEMWVYRTKPGAATLFSHGNVNESLSFGFGANNTLKVRVGKNVVESPPLTFESGQWAHVAMVYDTQLGTVSAFCNFVKVLDAAPVGNYKGIGNIVLGQSVNMDEAYFEGRMHDVRLWSKQRSDVDLQINSLKVLNGSETGLLAYYPLSEGKGKIAFDKARGVNAQIVGEWSMPAGKSTAFDGDACMKISSASSIAIDKEMDYTIEFWFKAATNQTNVALMTNELKGDSLLTSRFFIGFNGNGKLIFRSNGQETVVENNANQDYRDNNWHHFAVMVNRVAQKVETFVDGEMINQFNSNNIGGIGSDYISVGAIRVFDALNNESYDMSFTGSIDEIRIWDTALNQDLINKNNNTRLNGEEIGLMAYYPFEEYIEFQNNKELKYTLKDMKVKGVLDTTVPDASVNNPTHVTESDLTAPIKDRGPIENLQYDYVVSDKSLMINMKEPPSAIDKSTITFTVESVQDMFGNKIASPVTWSAYIDQNLLKWATDEINLTKKANEALSFEVDITNSGGSSEKYELENLPKWLKANPETGTIDPKSRQTVVFTVDEGTNIGSYNEIIYLRNSNNVTEPLGINLKVEGEKPNWIIDPSAFEYNMSIYGQLRINNIFSKDKEDLIAAFVDGKCVGVTNNVFDAEADRWFIFLPVYSNKISDDTPIEFRVWDSNSGKIYAATTTETITFKNQKIYGTSSNPLIFDTNDLLFQNLDLRKGWNWISFDVTSNSFGNVGSTLGTSGWTKDDIVKNDSYFDSYSSTNNNWVGTLSNNGGLDNKSMFMLKSNNAKTLSVVGTPIDLKTTSINVKGGKWNYISYLPTKNMTVKEALAGYDAKDGDILKSQEGFTMFSGNSWVGSLKYLIPNSGYMLFRTNASDDSFNYPSLDGSLKSTTLDDNKFAYRNYDYANNMSVVATIKGDVNLRVGDRLLALINDDLRGASLVEDGTLNELHFINVISDESLPIKFALERKGEIIAKTPNLVNYEINKVVGSLAKPFEVNFETVVEHVHVYPNPFTSELTIEISLDKESSVIVTVYDILGRLVKSWNPAVLGIGEHKFVWNANTSSNIANGYYIVSIKIDDKLTTFKVNKQ